MMTNRKNQIVKIAAGLFARGGYKKVTIKKIAEKCNISEAALYKHFKSKSDIYKAVLINIQSKISSDKLFTSLRSDYDVEHLLFSLARFISNSYLKHNQVVRLLLYSSLEEHSMAKEIFHSLRMPYIKFLSGKLRELIKAGKVVNVNPQITARCFVGMVFDCTLNARLWKGMAGRVYSHETTMKNNIPIFARGLIKAS